MDGVVVAVRLKGSVGMDPDTRKTIESLKLSKAFTAGLYPLSPSVEGMLKKAQRYLTWGKPNKQTIFTFLIRAGYVSEDAEKLSEALERGEASLPKPLLIRLRPPRKGFRNSVKRSFKSGGEYGDRGEDINELLRKML
ncbi:MAG: uL30 family ribosomal protein [Candidatus Caldarchaeum sp.]